MQNLTSRLNRSRRLGRLLSFFSGYLANYRGMPIIVGAVFILISLVTQIIGTLTALIGVTIFGIIMLHLGLLAAFVGILLAEPLGKG
jgi:hypothetical protein